eukprot:TRINITY_DN9323_c0_g1_i3.p5 TRINITY_DN9323_c0_g1~~TRINITY_DN9323_c0_g1_i3.p5  ORF type:complete len:109 (+),score=1.31 TRINITY_DN9323_c0_g1_i3:495-821(+)
MAKPSFKHEACFRKVDNDKFQQFGGELNQANKHPPMFINDKHGTINKYHVYHQINLSFPQQCSHQHEQVTQLQQFNSITYINQPMPNLSNIQDLHAFLILISDTWMVL